MADHIKLIWAIFTLVVFPDKGKYPFGPSSWWHLPSPAGMGVADAKKVQFVWLDQLQGRAVNREDANGDPCSDYDGRATKCRENPPCYYNCADHTCNLPDIREPYHCPQCSRFCHDLCGCKTSAADCQYDLIGGNCRPTNGGSTNHPIKPCHCSQFDNYECGRLNELYVIGGEICQNLIERGICSIDHTVKAVNLGCPSHLVNSWGISYKGDDEVAYKDPFNTRKLLELKNITVTGGANPKKLYERFIVAKPENKGTDRCLIYEIPLCQDGWYELIVSTIENEVTKPGIRTFNVKFNNVLILPEIDVYRIAKAKGKAIDLHINFQVFNRGQTIRIKGHLHTLIPSPGLVELAFCYGECDVDNPNYIVAGFSVIKFLQNSESDTFRFTNHHIHKPKKDDNCGRHGNNHCECIRAGCEDHVASDTCIPFKTCLENSKMCEGDRRVTDTSTCQRSNAFYVDGGALCKSPAQNGNCKIEKQIIAVKCLLNAGETLEDSRGIIYHHEKLYIDEHDTRKFSAIEVQKKNCNFNESQFAVDHLVYQTGIYGNPYKRNSNGCLSYILPKINEPGHYELSLKFLENYHKSGRSKRSFTVKINDLTIVSELHVLAHAGPCQPMEVILPFQITAEDTVRYQGFPELPNNPDHCGKLSFCYGKCFIDSYDLGDYLLSAFYIAKLDGGDDDNSNIISGK